jgi:hypothetical protein
MDTFSDMHLVRLASLPKGKIMKTLQTYSVRDNLLFHRKLQESLVGFSKRNKHLLQIQWELVCVAEMIRRAVWQAIYNDYKVVVQMKYPGINEIDCKRLTKEKTEALIKKYSY